MNNQEKRFLNSDFEVRNENDNTVIEGYAARFDDETVIGGQFAERVARGAFEGADMSNTVALFNHDWNMPLARVGKGLELSVDEVGLRYRFELGEQSYAKDLAENIRMGNVSTSSFGFTVSDDEWERRDGMNLRTINSVGTLFDVSPTTQGAYPTTEVAIRSMEAALEEMPVVAEEVVEEPVAEVVEEVVAEEVAEEVVEEERAYEEAPKEDEEDEESEESDEEEKAEERTEEVVADEVTEDAPAVEEEEVTEIILNSEPEARNNNPIMENTINTPAVVQGLGDSEARAAKDFNFGKFMSEAAKGNLTGLEAEMISEGKNEMRNAGLNVAGGFNIPTAVLRSMGVAAGTAFGGGVGKDDQGIVKNYAPNDIAAQLGIRNMAGLSGDVALQVQANLVAASKNVTEGATQAEALPSFAEKTLSPKRIAAHVGVTQQMLAQSSDDMAAFIQMDIRRALDKQFNDMIIDIVDDAVAAGNSTAYTAGSTSPLHLEEDLLGNDVNLENIVGLCDAKAFRTSRTLSLDAGSGLLYAGSPADRRSVLGYNTVVSSQVGGSGNDTSAGDMFFFDKSQVVTAQWGGLNLIVDPYTLAADGVVRMIANEYRDVQSLQAGGFARMTGL